MFTILFALFIELIAILHTLKDAPSLPELYTIVIFYVIAMSIVLSASILNLLDKETNNI